MLTLCAWCQVKGQTTVIAKYEEQPVEIRPGVTLPIYSHGICKACAAEVMAEAQVTVKLWDDTPCGPD